MNSFRSNQDKQRQQSPFPKPAQSRRYGAQGWSLYIEQFEAALTRSAKQPMAGPFHSRPPPRPPFISSEVLKSYSKRCTKKERSPVRILLESIAHAAAPSPGPGAAPWSQAAGSSQVQLTIFTYYTGGKRKPHVKLNLGKKKSFSCKDSVFHLAKYTFVLFHSDVQRFRILGVSHFSKPHIYKTETIKNSFFKKNRNTAVPLSLCSLSLSSLQNCILVTYRALKTLTTTTTVENIQNSFKAK